MTDSDDPAALRDELERVKTELSTLKSRVETIEQQLPEHETDDSPGETRDATSDPTPSPQKQPGTDEPGEHSITRQSGISLPNIEFEVGMKLLGGIGGIALVFAALFFVQLAIERGYIGVLGRLLLGTGTGVALLMAGRYVTINRGLERWGRLVTGAGMGIAYIVIMAAYWEPYREALGTPFWVVLLSLTVLVAAVLIDTTVRRERGLAAETVVLLWATVAFTYAAGTDALLGIYIYAALGTVLGIAWHRGWTATILLSTIPSYVLLFIWLGEISAEHGITAFALISTVFVLFVVGTEALRRAAHGTIGRVMTNIVPVVSTFSAMVLLFFAFPDSSTSVAASYLTVAVVLGAVYLGTTELWGNDAVSDPYLLFFTVAVALGVVADDGVRVAGVTALVAVALAASPRLTSKRLQHAAHATAGVLFLDALRVVYITGTFDVLPIQATTAQAGMFAVLAAFYFTVFLSMRETPLINDIVLPGINRDLSGVYGWAGTITVVLLCEIVLSGGALSIAWGLIGFTAIIIGTVYNESRFRIQGLLLLMLTTGKVFLVDMAGLDPVPRILSFIAVGCILLITSYFYAKTQSDIDLPFTG